MPLKELFFKSPSYQRSIEQVSINIQPLLCLPRKYANDDNECMFKVKIFVDVGGIYTHAHI